MSLALAQAAAAPVEATGGATGQSRSGNTGAGGLLAPAGVRRASPHATATFTTAPKSRKMARLSSQES